MLPTVEKAVDKCPIAEHDSTVDRSSPATVDCDRQATCFTLEATDAGALLQKSAAGLLASPLLSLFFVLVFWATFQPQSLGPYLRRPPPLPKAPIAYRFCILLN